MATDSTAAAANGLGFAPGAVVQEFYVDDDADADLRASVEKETGHELVDEDYADMADGALVWWREDDGEVEDLTDLLVDAAGNLDDGGTIWVLTPKQGQPNHVPPMEIEEAAKTAGLHATSATTVAPLWAGIRVSAPSRGR